MPSTVQFGDPPSRRQSRYEWDKIAADLRERPGEWARIFKDDRYSLAASVAYGSVEAFRPEGGGLFETRTAENRMVEESDGIVRRHCELWMRYVAPPKGKRK